jgi:hypothetical protein
MTLGGCNFTSRFPFGGRGGTSQVFFQQVRGLPLGALGVLAVAFLATVVLILFLAFLYINSTMRFVLFDSVVAKECHIRRFWSARQDQGFRYFLWQLLLFAVMFTGVGTIIGTTAIIAYRLDWLRNPREHLLPLILGGVIVAGVLFIFIGVTVLASVLAKDFVVPQMALENAGVSDSWNHLLHMMQEDPWAYAGYVGLKIVLSLGAMVAMAIAALMVIVAWIIPFGGVGLAAFLVARAIGLTWNLLTIVPAVLFCVVAIAALIYALALASVPVIVFFPAYSIHFFADRYPPLKGAL